MSRKTNLTTGLKTYSASNPILQYWEEIETGRMVVGKKVRRAYARLVEDIRRDEGRWIYDELRATRALIFIEGFCKHSK